ncbi:MAG: SBBP repeat-containing protein, partial [Ginsengibacter sp.]
MKSIKQYFPFFICLLVTTFFVTENLFSQIQFVENKGQWDAEVKFKSGAGSGSFYLTEKGFTVAQYNPIDLENIKIMQHEASSGHEAAKRKIENSKIRSHAYTVQFLNAQTPQILPDKPLPSVNNYFIGNDKSKWASNCQIYMGVTYKNIYPGIDIRYYSDGDGNLKYDFIVSPGAKIDDIAMRYNGAKNLSIKNRELNITTPLGVNKELKPYTYQLIDNQKQELECRYVIKGDVVKFKVKNYSPDKTLIIDPTEVFFSYSGSTADNWGFTATYGADGSFYGGGIVWDSGFPASPGGYDKSFNGDFDISIIKLSPDGRNRIYATYIGGSGGDQPHSLIVDNQGNLVLAGRSNSADYPVKGSTFGKGGGFDIVVTKLNASGSDIIGSMKIGGTGADGVNISDDHSNKLQSLKRNYGDDARSEVLLDGAGNIYVASCTSSGGNSIDDGAFPTTPGAFQTKLQGKQDAVVLKLNPDCNTILFSTLLGGKEDDAAYVLTLGNNNLYVAGGTASSDFFKNIPTSGVVRSSNADLGSADNQDPCDGFIVELNNTGTTAIRGTYIGTEKADQLYGIETDKFGFIYVMGTSEGNMQVINAAYSNANAKQFVTKLEPDLTKVIYQTVFGSVNSIVPNISPTAFLVDRCENIYVSGWGGKSNSSFHGGNTKGMPVTPDAIKSQTDASGSDFYFIVLKKNADQLLYGTFFGQQDPIGQTEPITFGDHVDGGTSRFDRNGIIYQAICANCFKSVPFPGTPGAWSTTNQSIGKNNGACNLGMLKIEMDYAGV